MTKSTHKGLEGLQRRIDHILKSGRPKEEAVEALNAMKASLDRGLTDEMLEATLKNLDKMREEDQFEEEESE